MSRSPSSSYSRSRSRSRSPRGYRDNEDIRDTVFAGNLNHETTEDELKRFFTVYGRVLETTVGCHHLFVTSVNSYLLPDKAISETHGTKFSCLSANGAVFI